MKHRELNNHANYNQLKRCVVLGGCGFLGSVVVRHLVSQGWDVRVFDKDGVDTWRLNSVINNIDLITGDIMNVVDLACAIRNMPTVLHFISTTIPQSSMNDIVFDVESNVVPIVKLLQLMRENPGQRLIYASSGGTVYGTAKQDRPFVETDSEEPICSYGVSKLMIEKYIQLFGFNYGLPHTILRFANPFGESQSFGRPQGAVGVFLHKVLCGEEIKIWGDGSVVRDYIYEADLASAVIKILNVNNLNGIYNIGSGNGTSLNELIGIISKATGITCNVTYETSRKFDVPYNVLDITKIYQATGWIPANSILDGLINMLAHGKDHTPHA